MGVVRIHAAIGIVSVLTFLASGCGDSGSSTPAVSIPRPAPHSDGIAYVSAAGVHFVVEGADVGSDFASDRAVVARDGLFGVIGLDGKWIVKPKYRLILSYSDGVAAVSTGAGWGAIGLNGEPVIPMQFQELDRFGEFGLAPARRNSKWGFVDRSGKWSIAPEYELTLPFRDGLAAVFVRGDGGRAIWFYIHPDGSRAFDETWDSATSFNSGFAAVSRGHEYGFITTSGNWLVRGLDYASPVREGVGVFRKGKSRGFVGADGRILADGYTQIGIPSEGLVAFRADYDPDSGWGYLDLSGSILIEPRFDEAGQFVHGLARVTLNGKKCYVNTKGSVVWRGGDEEWPPLPFGHW